MYYKNILELQSQWYLCKDKCAKICVSADSADFIKLCFIWPVIPFELLVKFTNSKMAIPVEAKYCIDSAKPEPFMHNIIRSGQGDAPGALFQNPYYKGKKQLNWG